MYPNRARQTRLLVTGLLAIVLVSGAVVAQNLLVDRDFTPTRIAVVDTFDIIDSYKKKEVIEAELKVRVEEASKQVEALETELKQLEAELKIIEEGSPEHDRLILKKTELGLKLKNLNIEVRRELESTQMQAVQEIREEVEKEIHKYAEAHKIQVVIEKKIPIEGRGAVKINIPIVRHAEPETDITGAILEILNARYQRILGGAGVAPADPNKGRP